MSSATNTAPPCQPPASHYVDGGYVEDPAGHVMESVHPATGEIIAHVHAATAATVDRAVAAARAAQADWSAMPGAVRGRILRRAADIMRERNAELSRLETLDTGKPIQETLVADPTSGADALEYFGGLAAGIVGEHVDLGGSFGYTRREPLGVVARSARGTIRSRWPAGRRRPHWLAATPWFSSHPS